MSRRVYQVSSYGLLISYAIHGPMVGGLKLPEHSHCKYCGDPVPFGEEFCNEECRAAEEKRAHDERMKEVRFWGSAVVVIAVIVAAGLVANLL